MDDFDPISAGREHAHQRRVVIGIALLVVLMTAVVFGTVAADRRGKGQPVDPVVRPPAGQYHPGAAPDPGALTGPPPAPGAAPGPPFVPPAPAPGGAPGVPRENTPAAAEGRSRSS